MWAWVEGAIPSLARWGLPLAHVTTEVQVADLGESGDLGLDHPVPLSPAGALAQSLVKPGVRRPVGGRCWAVIECLSQRAGLDTVVSPRRQRVSRPGT